MDEARADVLIADEMRWLRFQKGLRRFSEEKPLQRVTMFGPLGQRARLPLAWWTRDEQNEAMQKAASVAFIGSAQALMVASDSTMMDCGKVAEFLGLTVPSVDVEGSLERFHEEYGKLWRGPLMKRNMRNLPEECWEHSLIVGIRTPEFGRMTSTRYVAGVNDRVRFTEITPALPAHVGMVPEWWTATTNDPGLLGLKDLIKEGFGGR